MLPLRVRGLTYEAGGRRLIDGIDLCIETGGVTMVMGPNGAGKSLLVRLLHGLIAPTAGEVTWAGQRLDDGARRRQAMVFQKPVLLRRSVAANIDFVLGLRGFRDPGRASALLAEVGLDGRGAQPARLLSGGEQQRLALARALATSPEVLFLDEPTASLDPASTAHIEDIVGRVARAGTKVIFITHDVGQARRLASDVVFLRQGRVVEHAPAQRFLTDPKSDAARDFLAGRLVL
ncbi:MAG: phosphate ABC transporter ATP-binding protein [Hyphomicrobiaceae bacterium]|nr:phosphate ABC transporter ATP-binding protein [Hyphomicrobiaceae bacterium]